MRNITKFEAEVITDMHPLFKSLLWVSIARSKDDDRFILQHLHVERSGIDYHIVATDGKRLHVGTFDPGMFDDDICEIEPGEYEVIARSSKKIVLARADEAGNYPNWKQLMPDEIPMAREVVTRASISRIGIYSGVLLATDFVLEACGFGHGFGKDESVNIEFGTERVGGPFLIQHELGKAIVMPMSMDRAAEPGQSAAEATQEIDGLTPEKPQVEDVMIHDDAEGPQIVDEVEVNTDELLIGLEKCPKLQRKKMLAEMLKNHGAETIRKFDDYRTWVDADLHLAKVIQECINSLPQSQPEGSEDY